MDKDSLLLLQKIDCSCNDCGYMQRDVERYKLSLEEHHKWQLDYFEVCSLKLRQRANWYKDVFYDLERWDALHTDAGNMKFQFNRNEAIINFGFYSKLNKSVTFIPNTCSVENQECFLHRKELTNN